MKIKLVNKKLYQANINKIRLWLLKLQAENQLAKKI